MSKGKTLIMALAAATLFAAPAYAKLDVFACEPEWGALASEIGSSHVSVYTATTGMQDPHHIQARPSLIARARRADLTVCTGAELEIGWLPMVARQAANPKIQEGGPGAFEAARYVRLLEKPTRLDRADGDVHADGNPHIQTDPRNILLAAKPLADKLAELDPANAVDYRARLTDFTTRWTRAIARWEAKAMPLRGAPVAVQHKNWIYLLNWLSLKEVVALEPKPGVPPSGGYLAEVVATVKRTPVRMVIRANYEDSRPADFLAERAGVPIAVLPFTIGGDDRAKDLFSLYDDTIDQLLKALGHGLRRS